MIAPLEQPDRATEQAGDAMSSTSASKKKFSTPSMRRHNRRLNSRRQTKPSNLTDTEASFSAAAEPELEADPEQQLRIDEDLLENDGEVGHERTENFAAQQSPSVSDRPFTGIELSASFSFDPRLAPHGQRQDDSEVDPQPDSESIQEQEELSEAAASDTERLEESEAQFLNAVSEELEQNSLT